MDNKEGFFLWSGQDERVSCKNNDVSERRQFYCPKTRTSAKDRAKAVTMLQHTTNKMDGRKLKI